MSAAQPSPLADLRFTGSWRPYQQLALAAMERDLAKERRRTHIVAPPGSGKTLLGLEMVRRLAAPALVLTPNSAVQGQWPRAAAHFGADATTVATEPGAPITVLTYQSLCRLDDPAQLLGDLAGERWARERAAATGESTVAVLAAAQGWTGEAARRRTRELARITNAIKREIARSEHGDLHLGDLLHDGARERLGALRASGVRTVVLDECHHLASLWGYLVRLVVEELGESVHVIGLTATPPAELTRDEDELYRALLGPIDFTVPTPAVVKDGHLAPFQELAWFTAPLASEEAWLDAHDQRFRELVTTLHADPDGPLSFPGWVIERVRERPVSAAVPAGADDGADPHGPTLDPVLAWAAFARRNPRLARAGARFLAAAGLAPPQGAPIGEGYREAPTLDDWLVLLQDYVLRCLRTDPSPAAAARDAAIGAALRDLGYNLTRQGIRRGASDTDRVLVSSAAKPLALVEVLALEDETRGERLRALVLCDSERRAARADDRLVDVLPAAAGTAVEAVQAVAADGRTAHLRPTLVSGRGLRCMPTDASALMRALATHLPALEGWRAAPDPTGLVRIEAAGPGWSPRTWVAAATAALAAGEIGVMVGTRALLGEGWDAPCVNCLVDLTAVTTAVATAQMRGRSLRLDPADPEKLSSNWDVVCVAAEHPRGEADYERFVRKHEHLYAPADDGAIEAGPSHVHPALSPFAPPGPEDFAAINRDMALRAADHARARELWDIGTPYRGEEQVTVVVRPREARTVAAVVAEPTPVPPGRLRGVLTTGRLRGELNPLLPIERVAFALRDALTLVGELSLGGAARLEIEPRSAGYLRVSLPDADGDESARFSAALEQMIAGAASGRYVISRPHPGRRSTLGALGRALVGRAPYGTRWCAVPDLLANRRERAEAFATAWRRWLGPAELLYSGDRGAGLAARAVAAGQGSGGRSVVRRIWH